MIRKLTDIDLRDKTVFLRVDFNVPTEERDGEIVITDDTRMRASLPTIEYLREHGAKTILMAHFGRPKGQPVEKYSLRPVGLAAAIPALMAYNYFVQQTKVLAVEMDNFSHEFLNIAERHFFK